LQEAEKFCTSREDSGSARFEIQCLCRRTIDAKANCDVSGESWFALKGDNCVVRRTLAAGARHATRVMQKSMRVDCTPTFAAKARTSIFNPFRFCGVVTGASFVERFE
jgi:hypothetical protein